MVTTRAEDPEPDPRRSEVPSDLRSDPISVTGIARVDERTKDLAKRIQPGEIAVIDHRDLDTVAAESLAAAGVAAVVNAAECLSGRYPNTGPIVLTERGIPILDRVGPNVMEDLVDGSEVTIRGSEVIVGDRIVAAGDRQDSGTLEAALEQARGNMGDELQRFAANTLAYIQHEGHLLVDAPDIPEIPIDFRDRHVLMVVRGVDYKQDLDHLRRSGYLAEMKPILIGVDGGADALLEMGHVPDVIIGDMDSVSHTALRSGASIVVHGYTDGSAPGAELLDRLEIPYTVFNSSGTSEDIAMLAAYEMGAALIVAVGTHSSMVDFLDKGRAGMASTFLVRMKVGPILVDAKGVNRLYDTRIRKRDLLPLVISAILTIVIIGVVSDPIRLLIRGFTLPLR